MNHERMTVTEALAVLVQHRQADQITITNQGSAREWPKLCSHPLDFHYIPSTMSGAIPLGLGLAIAQPDRHVLVVSGDGSLLMSLGCLVSVVASGVTNLTIALLDNGVYEVTGGQQTAAAGVATDYAALAAAAGFERVMAFGSSTAWSVAAGGLLESAGPRFVHLRVAPVREDFLLDPPMPIGLQLANFRAALFGE